MHSSPQKVFFLSWRLLVYYCITFSKIMSPHHVDIYRFSIIYFQPSIHSKESSPSQALFAQEIQCY